MAALAVSFGFNRTAALCDFVEQVFSLSANEQVIYVHARWVVAAMADNHFLWHWAVNDHPYKSVAIPHTLIERDLRITVSFIPLKQQTIIHRYRLGQDSRKQITRQLNPPCG